MRGTDVIFVAPSNSMNIQWFLYNIQNNNGITMVSHFKKSLDPKANQQIKHKEHAPVAQKGDPDFGIVSGANTSTERICQWPGISIKET